MRRDTSEASTTTMQGNGKDVSDSLIFRSLLQVNTFVDHGPFAQRNAAPSCDSAASVGETTHVLQHAESTTRRSNVESFVSALCSFFKDNPTWE
jgi:hypothetical protein